MIDIKHLTKNLDLYIRELQIRHMDTSLAQKAKDLYQQKNLLTLELESKRAIKNNFNQKVTTLAEQAKLEAIAEMKTVAKQIKGLEASLKDLEVEYKKIIYQIPNLTHAKIPLGKNDKDNLEIKVFGSKPKFEFEPKNYFELPIFERDYLSKKGVEAFGNRGYYLRGNLVKLQRIIFNHVLDRLIEKGFELIYPPILVNQKTLYGTGFFPIQQEDIYKISGDKEFYLVGTSEAPLMFLESGNTVEEDKPRLMTAWTSCFRKEAGSYGKDTQGGIRVHQFEKVETVCICSPDKTSQMFDFLLDTFTESMLEFGLYLRWLEVCSGDMPIKNHRQVDVEAWFPAQGDKGMFRELSSCSNCTDYQTQNLKIYTKNSSGSKILAHSLNCTGVTTRAMFAIMEQFQTAEGKVKLPPILATKYGQEFLD
jgi:seryl-tRNA synthetase